MVIRCGKCKEYKSSDSFGRDKKRCRKCKSEYYRERKPSTYDAYIRSIQRDYGLTRSEYEEMLRRQSFLCAICKASQESQQKRFHLDHCHLTGKIRGILCSRCNTALGGFKDDIQNLYMAIDYLKQT